MRLRRRERTCAPPAIRVGRISRAGRISGAARVAALLAGGAALAACAGGTGPAPLPRPSEPDPVVRTGTSGRPLDRLTWALPRDPVSLDPLRSRDAVSASVVSNVCESLMRFEPDATLVPGLAERAERRTPTTWVYTLRPGVRFSDGTPMRADDVVFSLRRQVAATDSPWRDVFAGVRSVEELSADQVSVQLESPDDLFNEYMATGAGAVLSRTSTHIRGGSGPVCTGPYVVREHRAGRSVTLVRNESYWDDARAGLARRVDFQVLRAGRARADAVLAGRVDGTYAVPADELARLRSAAPARTSLGRGTAATSLVLTRLTGPLADERRRRALSLSIDRQGVIAAAGAVTARPAKAPSATGQWAGTPEEERRYFLNLPSVDQNPEEAHRLVAAAGVPDTPIVIAAGDDRTEAIAYAVQQDCVLTGLPIEVRRLSPAQYRALATDRVSPPGVDVDAYVATSATDVPDPVPFYAQFRSESPLRPPGFDGGAFDEVYARALAEPDRGKRLDLASELQRIVVLQMLEVPLYETPSVLVENRRVTGAPAGFVARWLPWAALVGGS